MCTCVHLLPPKLYFALTVPPATQATIYLDNVLFHCLALINRTGGLYGRILTEVVSTVYTRPRSRFSHTDRLRTVNKIFIIWQKQEQFNSFNVYT